MKINDDIRWGFIGCGEATEKKSGPAFSIVEHSSVVAVMSRSHEKARRYADANNIEKWYTDAQALILDPDVNAVYIATPPSSHATYAIMAMKAGKPAYIEKPMAATYIDCQRISRVSQETGVPCFCAYYRRFLPYFQKVKLLLDEGRIGKVLSCQLRFAVPPRDLDYNKTNLPWRVQRDIAGGGYFYDLAPHQIDMLQNFFGPIVKVNGVAANRGGLYPTEDTVAATFQFQDGLVGSGIWCFVSDKSAKEDRIELFGDRGKICFSVFTYEPIRLHTNEGTETFNIPLPPHVQLPLIEQIVRYLRGEGSMIADSDEATSVNWVMDKILGKM